MATKDYTGVWEVHGRSFQGSVGSKMSSRRKAKHGTVLLSGLSASDRDTLRALPKRSAGDAGGASPGTAEPISGHAGPETRAGTASDREAGAPAAANFVLWLPHGEAANTEILNVWMSQF